MMRRTAACNHLMKGLIIALAIVSSAVGEEAPDPFDSQAAKGPDPRKELRAEAALPGVDPDVVRSVVRPNMTLLADPGRSPVGNTVAIPPGSEQILIGAMRKELDDTKAELAKTKLLIGEVMQEYKRSSATPDLPPLPDAEVRVFQMKNTSADAAADKIKLLIGTQPVRIAIDEASNGLIVFGEAKTLPQVEQLVIKLDDLAVKGGEGFSALPADVSASSVAPQRTLMLRVFWLANDVAGLDAPADYLPPAVINSLGKLGLSSPQLVTQTVMSTLVEEGGALTHFSTDVPAVLFDQSKRMTLSGSLSATADNRVSVEMTLAITEFSGGMIGAGGAVALTKLCELNGSLAAPIGHFMVLGSANSVIADHSAGEAGRGMGMSMGRGMEGPAGTGMGMGRGMEGGGGIVHRGSEQGVFTAEQTPSDDGPPKLNSTRFAFVVQVVEAESFAPEE